MTEATTNNYSSGHPWYYKLGGTILKPGQIIERVKAAGYQGYMADDLQAADNKTEPQRSEALRKIKQKVISDYRSDMSCYRELACQLRAIRQQEGQISEGAGCSDLHTSISLKHNHLYNDFAHLIRIDELLSRQPDLFGF